jgi:hypothetical protein
MTRILLIYADKEKTVQIPRLRRGRLFNPCHLCSIPACDEEKKLGSRKEF